MSQATTTPETEETTFGYAAAVTTPVAPLDNPTPTPTPTPTATAETPEVMPRVDTRDEARNQARTRDDARPRSFQETKPKDTYFRPEYGWIMSDADVEKEQGVKGQFDEAITTTRGEMAVADTEFQTSLLAGQNDINSAYDTAIAGAARPDLSADMVNVIVSNSGFKSHSTYAVPRAIADHYVSSLGAQGIGSTWSGNNVSLNVESNEASDQVRQSLEKLPAQLAAEQLKANELYDASVANANTERAATLASFNDTSNANYSGQYAVWQAQLDSLLTGYDTRVSTGASQYADSLKKYNDSILNMDAGLLESPTNQVNTGRQ